jgi:hypothetical protein
MDAVDQLLEEFYTTTKRYRKEHKDEEPACGWPPIPFDFPTPEDWEKAHNEWRARAGLPLKHFPPRYTPGRKRGRPKGSKNKKQQPTKAAKRKKTVAGSGATLTR